MPNRDEWVKMVEKGYGPSAPEAFKAQKNKSFDKSERQEEIKRILAALPALREKLSFLPDYRDLAKRLKDAGAPFVPSQLHVTREELTDSVLYAKEVRSKYTSLWIAGRSGPFARTLRRPGRRRGSAGKRTDGLTAQHISFFGGTVMPKPKLLKDLDLSREALAQLMDFSVLNSDASRADIDKGIELSLKYHFKGFHTNTFWSAYVAERVAHAGIEAGWPVAFPFGCVSTDVKVAEAKEGARLLKGKPWVIDMVANSGMLKSGEYEYYKNDIAEIVKIAHDGGAECKAILEVQLLSDDQIRAAIELASEAGWTGSNPPPAAMAVLPAPGQDHVRNRARPREGQGRGHRLLLDPDGRPRLHAFRRRAHRHPERPGYHRGYGPRRPPASGLKDARQNRRLNAKILRQHTASPKGRV